ncbi:MAG TPA: hypothetical protein VF473_01735, partial [Cyclobacteriaceae bacterium]
MNTVLDLSTIDLPTNKSEEYRFTPVARALTKAFPNGFSGGATKELKSFDEFLVPGLDCKVIAIVDGVYNGTSSAKPSGDVFDQLNATYSKGTLTIGPSEKPVLLLNINTGSTNIHNRISVKVEAGASLSIIEKTINLSPSPVFQ